MKYSLPLLCFLLTGVASAQPAVPGGIPGNFADEYDGSPADPGRL
jgi:hypothetical protein